MSFELTNEDVLLIEVALLFAMSNGRLADDGEAVIPTMKKLLPGIEDEKFRVTVDALVKVYDLAKGNF